MALTAEKLMELWDAGKLIINDLTTNDDTLPPSAKQVKILQDTKEERTLLWSGTWGASGSSALTIAALADYTRLAFLLANTVVEVEKASAMHVSFQYSTSAGLYVRAYNIALSGNTLSIAYTWQSLASGSTIIVNNQTPSNIYRIWGIKP